MVEYFFKATALLPSTMIHASISSTTARHLRHLTCPRCCLSGSNTCPGRQMHFDLHRSWRGSSKWPVVHVSVAGVLPAQCTLHLTLHIGCCSLCLLCYSEEMRQQGGKFQLLDKLLVKLHKKGHRVLVFSQVGSSLAQPPRAGCRQHLKMIFRRWYTVCHAGWASCFLLACTPSTFLICWQQLMQQSG